MGGRMENRNALAVGMPLPAWHGEQGPESFTTRMWNKGQLYQLCIWLLESALLKSSHSVVLTGGSFITRKFDALVTECRYMSRYFFRQSQDRKGLCVLT